MVSLVNLFPRAAKASLFVVSILVISAFVPTIASSAPGGETRELRIALNQDIPDFNIFNLASNSVWKHTVLAWAFEGLSAVDLDGMPYQRLAESWTFNEGTLEVTIDLRHGVTFHDGSPMTADDVVFTYHALRDGTIYSSDLVYAFDGNDDGLVSDIEIAAGVWKAGEYSVGMQMAKPYGQFFTRTLGIPIIPQEIWQYHVEYDGIVDVLWNDPLAATGTGPFEYTGGVDGDHRIMGKFTGYWGTSFMTPSGHDTYPANVDVLYFKVYPSMNDAILALKAGAVDHIVWAVTSSGAASLENEPHITVHYLEDNAYFYLAFNQKLQPMNLMKFRQAISHLTDKHQIVDDYMGGLGSVGSAVEPPYWGEWHNESVNTYPYDDPFDPMTTTPEDLLDAAGLMDINCDGWRDLPDGTPMDKVIILAPPEDYDPVRIRAAEAMATNMREVGINAEAKAVNFDTLVARMNSMDYQMLILGWSLTNDPVGNVFDILGPKASSNTFGFWSEDDPNLFYKDLLGVNTLADAETQALAEQVESLGNLARSSFQTGEQMLYTRQAQGVISEALPVDVLYYRVSALATNDHWTGWVPYLGNLLNEFSLSQLVEATTDRMYQDASEGVNIGVSMPTTLLSGEAVIGLAVVIDDLGYPVEGAQVTLYLEHASGDFSDYIDNVTGTTDSLGRMWFQVTCTGEGVGILNASCEMDTWTGYDSVMLTVRHALPNTLAISAALDRAVIGPGEDAYLWVWVTDEFGDPVEGAQVTLDEDLLGYGSVNVSSTDTNVDGLAYITYHAPATMPAGNGHLPVQLVLTASKDGYEWTSSVMKEMFVYNDAEPDWFMTRVASVSTTALSNAGNVSTISVEVVDASGTPVPYHELGVEYSDESMVLDPQISALTDSWGIATIDLQFKNMAASRALKVTIGNETILNSVSASVTLTFAGSTPPAEDIYGGYMVYSEPAQYLDPLGSLEVTAHVWDCSGTPADGVLAALIIGCTPYGTLTWSDDVNWDTLWDFLGISIVTSEDDGNYAAAGPMNTPFDQDSWEFWGPNGQWWLGWDWGMMTGVPITGGQFTTTVYGIDVTHVDLISGIWLVPDALGFLNVTTLNYQVEGTTSIVSEYVVGRSYQIVTANHWITDPVLTAKMTDYETTEVNGVVTDENGDPVDGAGLLVYENSMTGNQLYGVTPSTSTNQRWSLPAPTDVNGEATAVIRAVGYGLVVTPVSIRAEVFVKPVLDGAISTLSQSQIFIHPEATRCALTPIWEPQPIGSTVPVTLHAFNATGGPVPYTTARLLAGGWMTIELTQGTDSSGLAYFGVDSGGIRMSEGGFMPVAVSLGGPAYDWSSARLMVPMQNLRPEVEILEPEDGGEVTGSTVIVHVHAFDADGIYYLEIRLDDGPWIPVFGPTGETTWDVYYNFTDVEVGSYTITAVAYDHWDVSGSDEVFILVPIPEFGYPALIALTMLAGIVVLSRSIRRKHKDSAK